MANINASRFEDVTSYTDFCNATDSDFISFGGHSPKALHKAEAQWIYEHTQYILTSTSVYQMNYSKNAGYYTQRLHYTKNAGYCKRGRFYVGDAGFIKSIVGIDLM